MLYGWSTFQSSRSGLAYFRASLSLNGTVFECLAAENNDELRVVKRWTVIVEGKSRKGLSVQTNCPVLVQMIQAILQFVETFW